MLEKGSAYELDPYVTLDAKISTVDIHLLDEKETTLSVVGRNLLMVEGPDPGYGGVDYPLAPMSLMVELRQEL